MFVYITLYYNQNIYRERQDKKFSKGKPLKLSTNLHLKKCRTDSFQSFAFPMSIFGFGLQEVKFFGLTSVMFITPNVGVHQRPAYQNQVG